MHFPMLLIFKRRLSGAGRVRIPLSLDMELDLLIRGGAALRVIHDQFLVRISPRMLSRQLIHHRDLPAQGL